MQPRPSAPVFQKGSSPFLPPFIGPAAPPLQGPGQRGSDQPPSSPAAALGPLAYPPGACCKAQVLSAGTCSDSVAPCYTTLTIPATFVVIGVTLDQCVQSMFTSADMPTAVHWVALLITTHCMQYVQHWSTHLDHDICLVTADCICCLSAPHYTTTSRPGVTEPSSNCQAALCQTRQSLHDGIVTGLH